MKSIFWLLLFLVPAKLFSQKKEIAIQIDSVISKWNKAIVNLEMRDDENLESSSIRYRMKITDSLKSGLITPERFYRITDSMTFSFTSSTGTAIFLKYENKRYLITARHVLFNKNAFFRAYKAKLINQNTTERYNNISFRKIFRVPDDGDSISLGNDLLNLGIYSRTDYIFSDIETDLAIVSLEGANRYFGDLLEKKGHIAIGIKDIDTSNIYRYGQDIAIFGYPFFTVVNQLDLPIAAAIWQSRLVFAKSVTFGKISTISLRNKYFISDANIAPGNSGGAIIRNNKLIGIVSSQPSFYLEDNNGNPISNLNYRMPLSVGVKSIFIMPLLRKLISGN